MSGASVMASLVIALFFLRFYRRTRDRLFAMFSLAFAVFAANRLALVFVDEAARRTSLYLVRLLAFLLILAAIVDKNASARR